MGDFISTKNTIDKSCVLSLHLSSSEQQMFKDYGFKVTNYLTLLFYIWKVLDKENSSLEQIALIPEILLWLWDLERSRRNVRTCIVLLTENVEYCSYLHELKDRG